MPCKVRNTCARYTQLARDAKAGLTALVLKPTRFTCQRRGSDATPLYLHDPTPPAPTPARRPWKPKRRTALEVAEERLASREFYRSKRR